MEARDLTPYQYFDLSWLKELSFAEEEMLNVIVQSFLDNLPSWLKNIESAIQEGSTARLTEAITRVSSVASLFTRRDLNHRFLAMKSNEDGKISAFTLAQVETILNELLILQREVRFYQNTELLSQKWNRKVSWRMSDN
jgi:hypothetical protein